VFVNKTDMFFHKINWGLKEDYIAGVCSYSGLKPVAIFCDESTVIYSFYQYFDKLWNATPDIDKDRNNTKRKLRLRIERINSMMQ
jgi:hypothetical protein